MGWEEIVKMKRNQNRNGIEEEMMQGWKQNQNRNGVEIDYAMMKKENKIEMGLRRDDNNVIKESVK